jgi:hypothetical protein
MPRVNLPHTNVTRTPVAPGAEVNGDPTNDHSTANDGRVFLLVRNAHATNPLDLTVHIADVVDGQSVAPKVYEIPAVSSRYVGPFPPGDYGSVLNIDVEAADLKLTAYHLG